MASQSVSDLVAELTAAAAVLEPQIRGLHDLTAVSISPDLQTEVAAEITDRERRSRLLQDAIDALNALTADGYPEMPKETVSQALYAELQEQMADLQAAAGTFAADAASRLVVNLGQPVPKT